MAPQRSTAASTPRQLTNHHQGAKHMVRSVLGILAGAVVWMAVFYALVILLALIWPDYMAHGRVWGSRGVFTFTSLMACFNLLFWVVAEIGAGWVTMKIARRHQTVWVFAALLLIYLFSIHILLRWPDFPWWYNLAVVMPAVPAVLLGARQASAPHPTSTTVAAA
jgi:hypothetical protein